MGSGRVKSDHLSQDSNQSKSLHESDQVESQFSKSRSDSKNRMDSIF